MLNLLFFMSIFAVLHYLYVSYKSTGVKPKIYINNYR